MKLDKPKFSVEVKGSSANVTLRARGEDLGLNRLFAQTRAIVLAKEDDRWQIRHVQLWSLSIHLIANVDGARHSFDLHRLLAAKDLPDQFLRRAMSGEHLWLAV